MSIGEILFELLGGAASDVFSSKRKGSPPPEGEIDASLGAVSGFLGGPSLMLVLIAVPMSFLPGGFKNGGVFLVCGLAASAALLAYGAARTGRRALRVTRRNRGLSRFGVGVGTFVQYAASLSFLIELAQVGKSFL